MQGAPCRRGGVARCGVVSVPACLAALAVPEVGSASGGAGGAMAADTQVGAGRARVGGGPAVAAEIRAARPHRASPRRPISALPCGLARCRGDVAVSWGREGRAGAAGSWGGGAALEPRPARPCSVPLRGAAHRSAPSGEPEGHASRRCSLAASRRSDTYSVSHEEPGATAGAAPARPRCRRSPSVVPHGWAAGTINWFFTFACLRTADSAARGNAARLVRIG